MVQKESTNIEVMTPRLFQVKIRESKLTFKYTSPARPAVSLGIKDYDYAPLMHPHSHTSKYRELSVECILSDLSIVKNCQLGSANHRARSIIY